MLLGVPDTTSAFPGVDQLGAGCRIDPTVSVMRFGERSDVVQLADAVSLYAQTRLVLGDVTADPWYSHWRTYHRQRRRLSVWRGRAGNWRGRADRPARQAALGRACDR